MTNGKSTACLNIQGASVTIFNRYGQLLFFSTDHVLAWDGNHQGKPLPAGTYYYLVRPGNGLSEIKGFITLLR
ncbi:gliding motility-associated C-terminal domain-containing protein [Mucilaginibacter sp. JRF]|nr:gliding motility-associated C-terminal domain-containing protein [Mucilaginibacter sp. JRF]